MATRDEAIEKPQSIRFDGAEGKDRHPQEYYDEIKARFAAERDLRLAYRPPGTAMYTSELPDDFANYQRDPYGGDPEPREAITDHVEVLFIGGGFSALLTSARLRERGVESIRIVERGADVGGTWYWNRYPGIACDVVSYDYLPLLDEMEYVPSKHYAEGPEIFAHCQAIARRYSLYELAVFQTTVTSTVWDEEARHWVVIRNNSGTLYTMISSTREMLVVPIAVNADGTFNTIVQGISATPLSGSATAKRTFHGRVSNGTLSGTIDELGQSFSATMQPLTGPTKSFTGVYTANTILSSSGTTHLVVSAQGQGYVLSINPTLVTAGTGIILPDGAFTVQTPQSVVVEGTVDTTGTLLTGAIRLPNRPAAELLGVGDSITRTDRLINISSLVRIGEDRGAQTLISGIVVGGAGQKRMLLRAIGPTLGRFGVQDALRNPRLQLFNSKARIIAQNDDWGVSGGLITLTELVGAFGLARGSLDSALVVTLDPGAYTLQIGSGDGSGVALLEIYDASEDLQTSSLVNLSTRGYIDSGESAIIGGFVVSGNAPNRVLVRGVGPALQSFGVTGALADPVLRIYQTGAIIAQNDDWETPQPVSPSQNAASGGEIASAVSRVGAFPMRTGSMDAAIIITLAPGTYTAEVKGANTSTGSGLLEIYQLTND